VGKRKPKAIPTVSTVFYTARKYKCSVFGNQIGREVLKRNPQDLL